MNLGLSGKISLVTGASSGIGASVALLLFAQEGADVIVCYGNNHAGAAGAQQRLVRQIGRQAWTVPFDITVDPNGPKSRPSGGARLRLGGLDALVLCAGRNIVTPFDQLCAEESGSRCTLPQPERPFLCPGGNER